MIIKIFILLLILSFFHALEELEIEGRTKNGWARCLPTTRINNKFIKFLINKELTLYHIYMLSMFFIIFHGIFLFIPWNIFKECKVVGFLMFYFVFEDVWWFLLNPEYQFKIFIPGHVSWHKRYWKFLPVSYWWGLIVGIGLLYLGGLHA
jgi:hypothetical protein